MHFYIDECINPTAPLYKQLFRAFAEDSAIEDAIYYLGQVFYFKLLYCFEIKKLKY